MAGGAGTRLWPFSRKSLPKQFRSFGDDRTLLQHMADNVTTVIPIEQVLVMAVPEFTPLIREQLPNLPAENILFEPARRDTGPAILLAMLQIQALDPEATVMVLWSDHLIQDSQVFHDTMVAAFDAVVANPLSFVLTGANPTYPETGFGYIQMSTEVGVYSGVPVFKVKRFAEKPDLKTATRYVASWDYLWNVGYQTTTLTNFFTSLAGAQPELQEIVSKLKDAVAVHNKEAITELYGDFQKISIDFLLIEKTKNLLVIPTDMGWSDLGNWNALHDILRTKANDVDEVVTRGEVISLQSKNSLILAKDRPIAIIGVEDLVVVDDGDCILVMHKSASQAIKLLNAELENRNPELL
jgi:mannose-1-phosphate guanylyltransferase